MAANSTSPRKSDSRLLLSLESCLEGFFKIEQERQRLETQADESYTQRGKTVDEHTRSEREYAAQTKKPALEAGERLRHKLAAEIQVQVAKQLLDYDTRLPGDWRGELAQHAKNASTTARELDQQINYLVNLRQSKRTQQVILLGLGLLALLMVIYFMGKVIMEGYNRLRAFLASLKPPELSPTMLTLLAILAVALGLGIALYSAVQVNFMGLGRLKTYVKRMRVPSDFRLPSLRLPARANLPARRVDPAESTQHKKFCVECGCSIPGEALVCTQCGANQPE
jgi:hypothetical protein